MVKKYNTKNNDDLNKSLKNNVMRVKNKSLKNNVKNNVTRVKNNAIFIGIDVSKATLDIAFAGQELKIKNQLQAITSFINHQLLPIKNLIKLCVLESTGGYESLLIKLLLENNIPTHRSHPNRVYAFAKASNHFAKTDRLDALLLEKYASFVFNQGERGDQAVDPQILQLQSLRKIERDLEGSVHGYKCRLDHLDGKAASYVKKQIKFAESQLKNIRSDIENIIQSSQKLSHKFSLLKSYKGVGNKIAGSLIAELPELGSLNHKEIANLAGVAPKTSQSGNKINKSHICGGRFAVRKSIYMAALVASRMNDKMKEFYQRLINKSKAPKVALVAIMRKIIICLNAMVRDDKEYSCA